jgi:putative DNA primase/helicase
MTHASDDQEDDPFAGLGSVPDEEAPPETLSVRAELLAACAKFELNDTGNARRFKAYFGDQAIWVPRVGWHVWTGKVWKLDADEVEVRRLAQLIAGRLLAEIGHIVLDPRRVPERDALVAQIADLDDSPQSAILKGDLRRRLDALEKPVAALRADHRRFARSTGNTARIDALLREAGVNLTVPVEALDANPLDLNTESGVLRFTVEGGGDTGFSRQARVDLIPHDRALWMTKIAPVEYDPDATCEAFDRFLAEVQPDAQMPPFLMRWLGLSMTALPVQALMFWYGSGANGKSVLAELIARLMGGYAASAKIKSLTGVDRRGGGDATPDLMLLVGARFVRASEPKEGEPLQEDLIKELTGGEKMMVRALHTNFIEFWPYFKLTMSGNHKPEVRGTDEGIWRRIHLVPWNVTIPEARRDRALGEKLWAERSGILNHLIAGLLDYLEGGLQVPVQVSDATREFREESDPVGTFLTQCCVITGEAADSLRSLDLVEAFNWWLSESGGGEWRPRTVSIAIKKKSRQWKSAAGRSFTERKASTMAYDGIRFTDVFGTKFRALHRDAKGNILRSRDATQQLGGEDEE